MPANLPPQYFELEKRYREARSVSEKLRHLEEMLAIMPKHKGTDMLKADLRRRIAQLKDMSAARKGPGRRAPVFLVEPEGVGQVALLGPPNTGHKSSLLAALTKAQPQVAPYPYTTRTPLVGMMRYENVQVQLCVDAPPIGEKYLEPWFPDLLRRAARKGVAGFPVFQAAPLDRAATLKGGPYSHGTSVKSNQFGWVEVEDRDGELRVTLSGRNAGGGQLPGLRLRLVCRARAGGVER